jgi:tetratricopeptide (TPR) repeat protein
MSKVIPINEKQIKIQMKRLVAILLLLGCFATAQNSKRGCNIELRKFAGLVKQKDYETAHQLWQILNENCAGKHVAIYAYGELTLKKMIELNEGPPKKESPYVDQIKTLYDHWIKYFPEQKGKILAKKARTTLDYKLGTEKEVYDLYDKAFSKDLKSFNSPKELYAYFSLAVKLYEKKEPGLDSLENLLDKYEIIQSSLLESEKKYLSVREKLLQNQLSSKANKKLKQNEMQLKWVEEAKTAIEKKLIPLMTCDGLVALYAKEFDGNKTNLEWLKASSRRMILKKCTKDLLFSDIVKALHSIEPSSNTASYLALIAEEGGYKSKMKGYYEEAYNLERDSVKKSQFAMNLAGLTKKEVSKAAEYVKHAIQLNPSNGEAYLLLAEMYAQDANNCGETVFEKRAVYWLSEKLARQAIKRDVLVASKAEKMAEYYSAKAPSKAEIFHEGLSGELIEVGCWIKQSVGVPSIE